MPRMKNEPVVQDKSLDRQPHKLPLAATSQAEEQRQKALKYKVENNGNAKRGPLPIYVQNADIDVKLTVLDEKISKNYLPLDFDKNTEIEGIDFNDLSNKAYVYVDDNGTPKKILILSALMHEINWTDLSGDAKIQIQNLITRNIENSSLIAGNNISIEGRTISANIGVSKVNGEEGEITITPETLNVYTKDVLYTKDESYSKTEVEDALEELIVDGGAYR